MEILSVINGTLSVLVFPKHSVLCIQVVDTLGFTEDD